MTDDEVVRECFCELLEDFAFDSGDYSELAAGV